MTDPDTTESQTITALMCLKRLPADEYVIAFGRDNRQFIGTPNGYTATPLPLEVLEFLTCNSVARIAWASFGSTPDSYFFRYQINDGKSAFQAGSHIPLALQEFICKLSPDLRSSLYVQLGDNDSFVAWAKTSWTCRGIPVALEREIANLSRQHIQTLKNTQGSPSAAIDQVAWHPDGSYFLRGAQACYWNFEAETTAQAWAELWSGKSSKPSFRELSYLALVALDPHVPAGGTFAFIKKQHGGQAAAFVFRVYQDIMHTSRTIKAIHAAEECQLQHVPPKVEELQFFRWAVCTKDGRPHKYDSWEVSLKKHQKVKVWKDVGNDWYSVETEGVEGYAHGSYLAFIGQSAHKDSCKMFSRFQAFVDTLATQQLRKFPSLREFVHDCEAAACKHMKSTSPIDICLHELRALLEGSSDYSYQWLKEDRIKWHPDKFARFCHAEHVNELKSCAQELFVLYGVLIDEREKEEKN
ncbi:hypothetical protein E8E13_003779 [Curvularia kusanoi]|uniref:Uncharacterized protein n=1 Tax=Curvularia kusanoi TaxID=90978 RepID=A0A9P4T9X5_CURKU|nr:hypothetical protein E8E13_003779 [Curvularia kusanoi]